MPRRVCDNSPPIAAADPESDDSLDSPLHPRHAMNFIDAHSHAWTQDTKNYPLAAGFRRLNIDPTSFTAEELIKESSAVGVNRVVLIQMSFYGYDNSYMLDSIRK